MQAGGRLKDMSTVHEITVFFNWAFLATQGNSGCAITMHDFKIERIGAPFGKGGWNLHRRYRRLGWVQLSDGPRLADFLARGLAARSNIYWRFLPFRPILPPEPPEVLAALVND